MVIGCVIRYMKKRNRSPDTTPDTNSAELPSYAAAISAAKEEKKLNEDASL